MPTGFSLQQITATASSNGEVTITWKVNQDITFNSLSNRTLGTGTFALSATASSALAVAFTSTTAPVCTVSGTTVTLVSAGTCTISASQAGNSDYNAATTVSRSFTVSSALSITTPSSGLSGTFNSPYSLSLSASGGASPTSFAIVAGTLPSGLTLDPSTGAISGTPNAAGNQTITARVTDANSATSTTSSFTISIAGAPLSTPSSPTVAVTSGTLKSFDVSWTPVANASSYSVKIYQSNGTTLLHTINNISSSPLTVTSSNFAGIADGTTYNISITAVGTGNYVSSSESLKLSLIHISEPTRPY